MDPEIEMLRRRVEYLEQALHECLERVTSLQFRVAELERRPVAVPLEKQSAPETPKVAPSGAPRRVVERLLGGSPWVEEEEPRR